MNTEELSTLVKEFNDARDARLALDREAKVLKGVENELKARLAAAIKEAGLSKVANVKYQLKLRPHVTDWATFRQYIIQTDGWDLLEKRPGVAACNARWEDSIDIPGVEQFPVDDLSIGKRVD